VCSGEREEEIEGKVQLSSLLISQVSVTLSTYPDIGQDLTHHHTGIGASNTHSTSMPDVQDLYSSTSDSRGTKIYYGMR